jgi:hypothetical protein
MLRLSGRLAFALSALWLIGCSDGSGEERAIAGSASAPGAGGTNALGSAGAGSGGATAGTDAGAGAGMGAAGSGSGGAMACTSYMDQTGYTLPVHIKNASAVTLYLGPTESGCQAEPLFQVEDGARHVLPSLAGCHTSCQALMQTGPTACPLACAAPSTITLAPGQTVDVPWDGRFAVPQTLPAQCMPNSAASTGSCVQAQKIEAAPFTFSAKAGTRRQCLEASGTCNCAPNADGTCTAASSVITGTIITTELFVKLEPGETSPGGEPQYLGLEFKDVSN